MQRDVVVVRDLWIDWLDYWYNATCDAAGSLGILRRADQDEVASTFNDVFPGTSVSIAPNPSYLWFHGAVSVVSMVKDSIRHPPDHREQG
ncbi:hypothetical protein JCM24511_00146 [Saitozyma sp. JCM 24511]|nr:hypothetical protein JCM24511_00146 [Saitozyma sp. JCM 24511]